MILGHHIDTPRNILNCSIGRESRSLLHQFLSRFRRHPVRQLHQHMSTTTHRFFNEQRHQWRLLQKSGTDFIRMPLLVEVQHQTVQRLNGIRNGSMVVLKLRAMRRPYWQTMLQLIVTLLYTLTHLGQPRLLAKLLPVFSGGREARGPVPLTYTSKFHR